MPLAFLERLRRAPMLCDGAMGTLLYEQGIFINRCYDELNLSQPETIRAIHREYVQAGADIIETNTFGANSFRLARHGCAEQMAEVNRAGARLARDAAKANNVFVAGSIGPLGIRIEPLGKTSREEAREAFREQIAAITSEGLIDVLILETFGYLEEIHQAILAARDAAPSIPVVAQVTIDEDGNCLDGSTPETFTKKLTEWALTSSAATAASVPSPCSKPSSAWRGSPTSRSPRNLTPGMPRSVEGRNIYLCSPEYMASYARRMVQAGVQLVGGCCGTTPDHIRTMKSALRAGGAKLLPPAHRLLRRR